MASFWTTTKIINEMTPEQIKREREAMERIRAQTRARHAAEQAQREMNAQFENAIGALIVEGKIPNPALLAEKTGAPQEECANWLAEFTRGSVKDQEANERRRQAKGTEAQGRIIEAQRKIEAAERALEADRRGRGLPVPDVDDEFVSSDDPHIRAVREARAEYADTRKTYGYLDELSRNELALQIYAQNQDAMRSQVAYAASHIRDSMQAYDRAQEHTKKLEKEMFFLQRRIASSRGNEQTAHVNIIRAHVAHWKLPGVISSDYTIPPRPAEETDHATIAPTPTRKGKHNG